VTAAIRLLTTAEAEAAVPRLAELLLDAVASGASVGFLASLTRAGAERFWASHVADPASRVLSAEIGGVLVGTASLVLAAKDNQRHRADVVKLIVDRSARRAGVASALMAAIDEVARAEGRTTLVLDTATGTDAERLYTTLGWVRVGSVPDYADMPDGTPAGTTFFFKHLPPGPRSLASSGSASAEA
jgi:GNAT superfamily N-acetyltransferase